MVWKEQLSFSVFTSDSSQKRESPSASPDGEISRHQTPTKSAVSTELLKTSSVESLEQAIERIEQSALRARSEEIPGIELQSFPFEIPPKMWPEIVQHFEKDNPAPPALRFSLQLWGKNAPDSLLEFKDDGFRRSFSKWRACEILVDSYAPTHPEIAYKVYRDWDREVPIDQTDRSSWSRKMVQSLIHGISRSQPKEIPEWLTRLNDTEKKWAQESLGRTPPAIAH